MRRYTEFSYTLSPVSLYTVHIRVDRLALPWFLALQYLLSELHLPVPESNHFSAQHSLY